MQGVAATPEGPVKGRSRVKLLKLRFQVFVDQQEGLQRTEHVAAATRYDFVDGGFIWRQILVAVDCGDRLVTTVLDGMNSSLGESADGDHIVYGDADMTKRVIRLENPHNWPRNRTAVKP